MDAEYRAFLAAKAPRALATGIEPGPMPAHLFDFQADVTAFLLRQGRGAAFLGTGLGKSAIQIEWSRQAAEATNGRALILTPLAVARQIETEARRWGYDARVIRSQDDAAAEDADERHLCPLQLPLIERALTMWSNPGDVVLSPFLGIGSEGVVALRRDRKFIGIELKPSYFRQACRSLDASEKNAVDLFGGAAA